MADLEITYEAKRGLIAGHTNGAQYPLSIDLRSHIPRDRIEGDQVFTSNSAAGKLYYLNIEHQLETKLLSYSEMLAVREFLLSCSASEQFTFSVSGSANVTGVLVLDKRVEPSRPMPTRYRYRFTIREVN